jgi:hypothetical protein
MPLYKPVVAPPTVTVLQNLGAATAWPAVNRAVFVRCGVTVGGTYRYLNWRCDVQSGNVQVGVVRLSGVDHADFTRVMNSGVIACPAAGNIRTDLGATYLTPGDYAMFLWADNVTFQARYASNSGLTVLRANATLSSLATGVQATGTFAYGTELVAMTLEGDF